MSETEKNVKNTGEGNGDIFTRMSKYIQEKWKKSGLRRLRQRINRAIRCGIDELPDIINFVRDNLDLAMTVALEIAKEYAEHPNTSGSFKKEIATDRIKEHLGEIKYREHWIQFLIEVAVAILKSKKLI